MIRIILINLLLLLLPIVIYFGYVYFRRRENPHGEILANAPIFWLLAGGAGLMLLTIIILGRWEPSQEGGRYVPPQVKDGVVIPGHIEHTQ